MARAEYWRCTVLQSLKFIHTLAPVGGKWHWHLFYSLGLDCMHWPISTSRRRCAPPQHLHVARTVRYCTVETSRVRPIRKRMMPEHTIRNYSGALSVNMACEWHFDDDSGTATRRQGSLIKWEQLISDFAGSSVRTIMMILCTLRGRYCAVLSDAQEQTSHMPIYLQICCRMPMYWQHLQANYTGNNFTGNFYRIIFCAGW